ncbi:hypothetical protein [Candidatus Tisiphia endosymbiont of Oplodontha viridula]|uniref:hypothetical protein n=1 Tax=Candidatus Tisiphia endosymbiont of Oplodontha viridula TaxID=3077925 RepID=UPI0035C883F4
MNLYVKCYNNTESIVAIDKAISLKPNFADAYYNKNITLKVMDNSVIVHDEVTTLNPNYTYTETYNNTDLTFYEENVLLVGDML